MKHLIFDFLLHVVASTLGILIASWLCRVWDDARRKIRYGKKRR